MFYLLHIPKTGGQTLATRLASAFPADRSCIMQANIDTPEELADLVTRYDFVEGHPAGGSLSRRPAGLQVLAAVRDPVEQVISHYRHIRREPKLALHKAAVALPPTTFLERFPHVMFNFQARCLVRAFGRPTPQDLVRGEELWLLRSLEAALAEVDRPVPSERIDEFCLLFSLETGLPLRTPEARVNESGSDAVDVPALRAWPECFAVDSLLWQLTRRRYAEWRERLVGTDRATGTPAPATLAWSEGEAAIWLTRDWHAPIRRNDGVVEWWAGPGMAPEIRLRTGGRRTLHFEAPTFLGVRWDRIRLLRRPDLVEVEASRSMDPATHVVTFTADLGSAGGELELVLLALEDVRVLPAVPPAFENPRRAFATQNWRLT